MHFGFIAIARSEGHFQGLINTHHSVGHCCQLSFLFFPHSTAKLPRLAELRILPEAEDLPWKECFLLTYDWQVFIACSFPRMTKSLHLDFYSFVLRGC